MFSQKNLLQSDIFVVICLKIHLVIPRTQKRPFPKIFSFQKSKNPKTFQKSKNRPRKFLKMRINFILFKIFLIEKLLLLATLTPRKLILALIKSTLQTAKIKNMVGIWCILKLSEFCKSVHRHFKYCKNEFFSNYHYLKK